jgi:RHS repeat-associated protein
MLYWYGRNGEIIAESDLSGTVKSEYIYFAGRRIARRDPGTGNAYYYLTDHLGSTRLMTNASGAVVEESEFYPFGTERVITNGLDNNYKFAAMERDTESGLDHTLYRKYSASLARWLSPDPDTGSPENPQSLNRYPYVLNDPTSLMDPEGNSPQSDPYLVGCFPDSPLSQNFGCGWDESSPCPPGFVAIYGQPSWKGGPAIETLQSDLDYADIRLGPYSSSILTYDLGPDGINVKMSLEDFQMLAQFNPILIETLPIIIDEGTVILEGLRIGAIAALSRIIDRIVMQCDHTGEIADPEDPTLKSCVYACDDGSTYIIDAYPLRDECPGPIYRIRAVHIWS